MTLLEWALTYARRGWPVFPCHPDTKRPLVAGDRDAAGALIPNTGGVKKASTDPEQIEAWWRQYPNAMIGFATGNTPGVFVLDLDAGVDDNGEIFTAEGLLRDLENEIGVTLQKTWQTRTPRGGWHLFFTWQDTETIGNRGGMIPRVDVRGEGGYVILPPSARSDGAAYEWVIKPQSASDRPASAPPALLDCVLKRGAWAPASSRFSETETKEHGENVNRAQTGIADEDAAVRRYADAALAAECDELARCGKGGRNARLNIAAVKLGGYVAANALHEERVRLALYAAAEACGLVGDKDDGPTSVRNTINSGLRHGRRSPTKLDHVRARARERSLRATSRLSGPLPPEPPPASFDDYGRQPSHAVSGNAALAADVDEEPAANVVTLADRRKPPRRSRDGDALLAELIEIPETDVGNAERFHARYDGRLLYCQAIGWLHWCGTHWTREAADGRVASAIQGTIKEIAEEAEFIEEHGPNPVVDERKGKPITRAMRRMGWCLTSQGASHVQCLEKMARHRFEVQPLQLDADPWKFNTASGTLVIRRGEGEPISIAPHDPADLITKLAPVDYDPDARAPGFAAFFARVQPADGMRRFLAQWLGYSATGDVGEQKLVFNWGKGANGKSTLYDVIGRIVGDYGKTVPIETFLAEGKGRNAGQATPDLAALPGVRFLRTSEPERNAKMAEALIKLATGGEEMMVRHLNKDYFAMRPAFKLSMSGNYRPHIVGNDDGIWRRMQLVPWEIQIPAGERDKSLPEKLWAERSGILNWLLAGLRDYLENGLIVPDEVTKATAEYRSESDPLGRFLAVCTAAEEGARTQSSALYAVYQAWAKANGQHEWTATGFGRAMREKGYHSIQSNVIFWLDLRAIRSASDFLDGEGRPIKQHSEEAEPPPAVAEPAGDPPPPAPGGYPF